MAGWAYSNWGEQQELDQQDQLRAIEAKAQARALNRQEEARAFLEAKATLPQSTSPSLLATPLKPNAATLLKSKSKPVLPSFIQKKRTVSDSIEHTEDRSETKREKRTFTSGTPIVKPIVVAAATKTSPSADKGVPVSSNVGPHKPVVVQACSSVAVEAPLAAPLVSYDDSEDDESGQ
uniref:Uncharacterized protein n=1 Tax=Chrysotila carterae TaxID=13221 RepID=A0A7S4C6B2_CHRCT|mmetsp:Transcript_4672/g.10152  ORF Transcript_4672/g.10152 Transcript_4672/m.10152 type:complete len:178 (+) Transcript_4672:67-600(+)|eukprot:6196702-Pleurochrysis_carterae.AAC.1